MEEHGKSSLKEIDLSDLFPLRAERENEGFATKPAKFHPASQGLPANAPAFANLLRLKTFDSNLSMEFAFSRDGENFEEALNQNASTSVIVSSETAKQLLLSLVELFQCEINPGKPQK